jgi:hypothetical protein
VANNCTFVKTSIHSSEKFYDIHSDFMMFFMNTEINEDSKNVRSFGFQFFLLYRYTASRSDFQKVLKTEVGFVDKRVALY